ncbi:hypothetical protein [Fimbriimonas ginsengisoli]|uniref:Uncharacterized protein n=1 Tax=Fimbriimonas ginsengisoli Gsoil 348 TaxID=661478 RepID=A0A068NWJ2_FIMGI|nr:hypothetical protein [Fimbriimonas ginsengisoli]AIE87893.1 hypothetical protein OP10G_4525 [Fimbriimonas ginsengisoli Gsoil 348]
MRRFAFALLLGLGSIAFAQDAGTKVTFTGRAARVETILAGLSQASGVKLSASAQTADEILIVSAKDVSLSDLMARIATATSGEWHQTADGYRLAQSVGARTREENESLNARVTAIRKGIAKHLQPPKKSDKSEDPEGPPMEMFGGNDASLYQIVAKADLNAIAALRTGERVVFSTNPTRTQRPFAGNVISLINAYVAEHNKQVSQQPAPEQSPEMDKMPDFVKKMMDRMTKPVGQVSKALFVVSRMGLGTFGMMQAELRLYDAQGKVALTTPTMLESTDTSISEMMQQIGATKPDPKKPKTTATPIDMTEDTKAFQAAFKSSGMSGMQGLKIPATILDKLYRPDQYDPLSFLATDEVLSLAKKTGKPVVAVLPDDIVSLLSSVMPNQNPTVEQFEKSLESEREAKVVEDPAWLVIKPSHPAEARDARIDRKALARLLDAARTKGVASLDDVAQYALKAPSPMEGGLGSLYVLLLVPGAFSQSLSGFTNWEMLRFYGTLEPVAKQTLLNGGRIPFSGLTAYQHEQVRRMAYGAMPSLEIEEAGKKNDGFPSFMRAFIGGSGDYREEPTELLPNGLPGDGYVEMKGSIEPYASAVTPDGTVTPASMAILDADMLAMFKMLREDAKLGPMASMMPNPDKVKLGQKTVMAFTFQVAPTVAMHQTLNDHQMAKDAQVTSMANLPDNFKQLIATRQDALKKSPFGSLMGLAGMGMGGRTVIKP